jgi:hypothetical protein
MKINKFYKYIFHLYDDDDDNNNNNNNNVSCYNSILVAKRVYFIKLKAKTLK